MLGPAPARTRVFVPAFHWSVIMPIISQSLDVPANTALAVADADDYYYILKNVQILGAYGVVGGSYTDVHVINDGSIFGIGYGITFDGSRNDSVSNSASGTIDGDIGIDMIGVDIGIYNAGAINGTSAAVSLADGEGRINNIGSITSQVDAIVTGTGSNYRINNSGVLSGDDHAYSGGTSSDVMFRNTGSIVGDVTFGSGQNVFNGRGGTLNGTIYGGSNADTVYLGNDGETVRGGDGADNLYAGAGADTFVFTQLSQFDVDHVHGFNAAFDTIQLEHASFNKLAIDAPVVFANGAKATSAADHLFYNASNGALYYDADGSGTKAAAQVIARLDTGLHLTGRNFQVIAGFLP